MNHSKNNNLCNGHEQRCSLFLQYFIKFFCVNHGISARLQRIILAFNDVLSHMTPYLHHLRSHTQPTQRETSLNMDRRWEEKRSRSLGVVFWYEPDSCVDERWEFMCHSTHTHVAFVPEWSSFWTWTSLQNHTVVKHHQWGSGKQKISASFLILRNICTL